MQACQYLSGQSRLRTVLRIFVQHLDDRFLPRHATGAFTHTAPGCLQRCLSASHKTGASTYDKLRTVGPPVLCKMTTEATRFTWTCAYPVISMASTAGAKKTPDMA
jgi:hypothetical protein